MPERIPGTLKVFSTCPQSADVPREAYLERVALVARWSDEAGCEGILVYTDNRLVDPWLVSQVILQNTRSLCPLVAVQPVYMHPYSVAKMVSSLGHLYGRRIYLNMVAGGFTNDLVALNDTTPHDKRYDRLHEYTFIIKTLLEGREAVTFEGEFYRVERLKLSPPLRRELFPGILLSGSSEAGWAAARALDATAVIYPKPPAEYEQNPPDRSLRCGVRVGIIARGDAEEAWRVAHERFPEDRAGQLLHQLAMKTSDSLWHRQLSDMARRSSEGNPYWMHPFENYKTFCPYLVGSYEQVATEVGRYVGVGYSTFILDIPASEEELKHIATVFHQVAGVPRS